MSPHRLLRVGLLLLSGACASSAPPRVIKETKQLAPHSFERPQDLAQPFEVSHEVRDGEIRVKVVQGPCVTTTEAHMRVQEVTIIDGRRIEGEFKDSVERSDSPPHACSKGLAGSEVRVLLPTGSPLVATLGADGSAVLPMPDEVVSKLYRSAHGVLSLGRYALDLPLDSVFVSYIRRARADFGEISVSDVVSSSGRLTTGEVLIEVAVSPRNAKNEFGGAFLPEQAFHFEGVELVPVDGGPALPVNIAVERVEISRPGSGSLNVALVLDSSGSMRDNDPTREGRIRGGEAVVREVTHNGQVAVLDFGLGTTRPFAQARLLQDFTNDVSSLNAALRRIGESGGTPLYTSIKDAIDLIGQRGGVGSIVALTDGEAQDSSRHKEIIELARARGIPLFAVGLGATLDFADLRHLGLATGGGFAEARDAEKLAAAFRGVGIGLAYGRVAVFGRGSMSHTPAPGRYRVRGALITDDPDSKARLRDPFDTLAVLDPSASSAGMTLAAGGCNPDCYYDAACNILTTGGGKCCEPIANSIHGSLFAAQCRAQQKP